LEAADLSVPSRSGVSHRRRKLTAVFKYRFPYCRMVSLHFMHRRWL